MIEVNSKIGTETLLKSSSAASLIYQNECSNISVVSSEPNGRSSPIETTTTPATTTNDESSPTSSYLSDSNIKNKRKLVNEAFNNNNNSSSNGDDYSLGSFIKRYISNKNTIESENKRPKKSFFICDILGNDDKKHQQLEQIEKQQAAAVASNFLLNLSYSNLVTNLLQQQQQQQANTSQTTSHHSPILSSNADTNNNQITKLKDNNKKLKTNDPAPAPSKMKQDDSKQKPLAPNLWPAWVYCTRYSDRPSAGPRHKRSKKNKQPAKPKAAAAAVVTATTLLSPTAMKFTSSTSTSSISSSTHSLCDEKATAVVCKKRKLETVLVNDDRSISVDDELNSEYDCGYDDDDDDNDSTKSNSKRPRTAFTSSQLHRLKDEFNKCKYLTGEKRQYLANELKLNESQIKIWFQNKRAKIKKSSGVKNALALQLMAQGLYNHGATNKTDE